MATLQYHDNGYGHAVVWHKYRITVVQAYLALYLEVFTLLEEAYIYIYILYMYVYIYTYIYYYTGMLNVAVCLLCMTKYKIFVHNNF